jgi:copper chaperone CopZ
MTCTHCVRTVKSNVFGVAGVASVEVELEAGRVIVTSEGTPDAEAVRSAIEQSGYEFIPDEQRRSQ